jgi:hypothetical protein
MRRPALISLALVSCLSEPTTAPPPVAPAVAPDLAPSEPAPAYHSPGGALLESKEVDGWVERAPSRPASAPDAGLDLGELSGGGGLGARGYGIGGGGTASGFGSLSTSGYGKGGGASSPSAAPEGRIGSRAERHRAAPTQAEPLRAARTDDNQEFSAFLEFLATWSDRPGLSDQVQRVDVSGRTWVEVRDASGAPAPDVQLTLLSGDRVVHRARTYGDGRAPLYPSLAEGSGAWSLRVDTSDGSTMHPWTGEPVQLTSDLSAPASQAVPLDVAILLDTTGSMGDEIDRIKQTLFNVTERVKGLDRPVDLRFGAVLYRDLGDDYVTRRYPFTSDVKAFDRALRDVTADGGGDMPESLNQGLAEVVHGLTWREHAARVSFLVADAAPHMDYEQDRPYGDTALAALAAGIRVHTVAASGLDPAGTYVFRQIAQLTRGEFIFIEYGSTEATARSHGVSGAEQRTSNNLDQILFERIAAEVEGWRR